MYQRGHTIIVNNNTEGGPAIVGNNFYGDVYFNYSNPERNKRACLKDLFLTDPAEDRERLTSIRGSRVEGTCEWIRNHETYISWFCSQSQLLWLSGDPGQGKTFMSIFLSEEFRNCANQQPNVVVLEYYCNNQDEKRNTAVAVIRGLIFQLLDQRETLFPYIMQHYEVRGETIFLSFETLWSIFELMLCDETISVAYCIIDGLDECEKYSLGLLLGKLNTLFSTRNTPFRCCLKMVIASREYPDCISEELSNFPHIHLDPKDDIHRFIEGKVEELTQSKQYPDQLRAYVRDALLSRAGGTFLWVGIVVQHLRKLTRSEVESALALFPAGLEGLYTRMLHQILPERKQIAAKILLWVIFSVRPLTISELGTAIGAIASRSATLTWNDIIRDQISSCGCFLTIMDDEVHLVHQSAKDYLLHNIPDGDLDIKFFRFDEYKGNLLLAKSCFSYLQGGVLAGGWVNLREKTDYRINDYPLLSYAALHFPDHARVLSSTEDIFNLSNPIYRTKSKIRDAWIRTYWCAGVGKEIPGLLSLLHVACCLGIVPLVKKLLKKSWRTMLKAEVDVNDCDGHGRTPLSYAAMRGQEAVVKLLLEQTYIIADWKDRDRRTPLALAAELGHELVVKLLLDRPDVLADSKSSSGETPLMSAAILGYDNIAQILLARENVDVNACDSIGNTALQMAAWHGHHRIVKRLFADPNTRVNVKDIYGNTPLSLAASYGYDSVVRLLLERPEVSTNSLDGSKRSALLLAAEKGHNLIVRALLEQPDLMPDIKDELGNTPLFLAARYGHSEVVQLLLGRPDVAINISDDCGRTPLVHAAERGHETIVQLLLKRPEILADWKDSLSDTPLLLAAHNGHNGVVEMLLKRPDVATNNTDFVGKTPLSRAAENGHKAVVGLLLGRPDVIVDWKDEIGFTPLSLASLGGHVEALELLRLKVESIDG